MRIGDKFAKEADIEDFVPNSEFDNAKKEDPKAEWTQVFCANPTEDGDEGIFIGETPKEGWFLGFRVGYINSAKLESE